LSAVEVESIRRLQARPWSKLTERAGTTALDSDAARRAAPVVVVTALAAVLAIVLVARGDIALTSDARVLSLVLVAVGIGAEIMSFSASKNASGSIALIPFAATVLVAPSSLSIGLVVVAEAIVQASVGRPLLKSVFNLSHNAVGLAVGILAYRLAGGVSFVGVRGLSFLDCAQQLLLPATFLVLSMFAANTLTVSAVLSATSRRKYWSVVSHYTRTTAPFTILIVLLAFYLTWLSVNLGVLGTVGMAIPMVAVRQLYKTAAELTNVTEELLDLMVAAIEARDPYTSGHSKRVAAASEIIARAIGLNAQQIERVTVAALLHDVGKIDEAFAKVLAKEGRLTPDEWSIMKKHPIRSAELVGMLSSLKDLVAPVRHHHENFDGTGYPDGLSGVSIPLASRIIMFADTLDAITTDRPYRKALGMEEARSEFLKFRGKQFDPQICDRVVSADVWAELYESFGTREAPTAKSRAS
jgi:putative nucleotidyltransferase with HDIG domain